MKIVVLNIYIKVVIILKKGIEDMNDDLIKNLFKLLCSNNMMLQALTMKLFNKVEYDEIKKKIETEINETFKEVKNEEN